MMKNVFPNRSARTYRLGFFCAVAGLFVALQVASAESPPGVERDAGLSAAAASAATEPAPVEANETAHPRSDQEDHLCAWGRLANGHGVLLRCLSADEARVLGKSVDPESAVRVLPALDHRPVSGAQASILASPRNLVFDGERLSPAAKQRLALLSPEYERCAVRHGGLSRRSAEVRIRFRVSARGNTFDASVSRRRAITAEAARCVADVVNRRAVGVPKTGATIGTLVIRFTRQKS